MTMQDKFNEWFNKVDGQTIEREDASNLDQCFDLAFDWCDFLGIPRDSIRHFRAYQIFTEPNPNTTDYWDLVVNTPTGVPQVGDLVIFGIPVGVSGHVCIFKEGDSSQFTSEDQNWAGVQKARLVKHSYNGVLGWLHLKSAVIPQVITQTIEFNDQTKIPAAQLGWDQDLEIQQVRGLLTDLVKTKKELDGMVAQAGDLKRQLIECQTKPTDAPTTGAFSLATIPSTQLFGELVKRILGR